jgi:hypothetical protein
MRITPTQESRVKLLLAMKRDLAHSFAEMFADMSEDMMDAGMEHLKNDFAGLGENIYRIFSATKFSELEMLCGEMYGWGASEWLDYLNKFLDGNE